MQTTVVSKEEDNDHLSNAEIVVVDVEGNVKDVPVPENPVESAEAQLSEFMHHVHYMLTVLDHLMKNWTAPVYAFFYPIPEVGTHNGRCCHMFKCFGRGCGHIVRRYLDTRDRNSTSNLIHHVRACKCWGNEIWEKAKEAADATDACENITKPIRMSGSITAAFQLKGKGKVTYSHCQHTKTETR